MMTAKGASKEVIEKHIQKAREIYEKTGMRADGTPLQPNDLEYFLKISKPKGGEK